MAVDEQTINAALFAILDDEEIEDRERVQRVPVDLEGWRILDGVSFQRHFRMQRPSFEVLIVTIGNHLTRVGRLRRFSTPLDVGLMMTLWVLANPDTFRSVGSHFGFSEGSVFHYYSYMIEALRELAADFIKWPSPVEREIISAAFYRRHGIPGVVGCIDGTYMKITAPLVQPQRYVDRHHDYSILVQAVCDHNLLYRDVYVGQPGSVGDARMFSRSPLSNTLLRCPNVIREDEHLLGDGAYPLLGHLLVPYTDDGFLTALQRAFNFHHAQCRSPVERSFALLFGRWDRIKYYRTYNLNITVDHITASLVVHNFTIIQEHADYDEVVPEGVVGVEQRIGNRDDLMEESRVHGALKREYIAEMFQPEAQ